MGREIRLLQGAAMFWTFERKFYGKYSPRTV